MPTRGTMTPPEVGMRLKFYFYCDDDEINIEAGRLDNQPNQQGTSKSKGRRRRTNLLEVYRNI